MAESPLEAAAKAAFLRHTGDKDARYWDLTISQEHWHDVARAAIAAYEAEQPAPDLDEDELVDLFWDESRASFFEKHDAFPGDAAIRDGVKAVADRVLAHLKGATR